MSNVVANVSSFISDKELTLRFQEGVKIELEKKILTKKPIARFERETSRAYIETPNGKKQYVR